MEKSIKHCAICNGVCQVKTIYVPGKKYQVVCTSCGNESEIKSTPSAAIKVHNKTNYWLHKTLF